MAAPLRANVKDLGAGLMFVAIGLFFGLGAWTGLRLGTARAMGPGFFPTVLSVALVVLGAVIAGGAIGKSAPGAWHMPWRGAAAVVAAIVFFAATVRGLGMGPALAGATLLAALSTPRNSFVAALALAVVLTAFCLAVFIFALRLPYPVLGPWLRGA